MRYAGIEAPERRAARRARLLDAALELISDGGWGACTVRAVCSRAQLTPRYFYESFAERDALLLALFDEVAGEVAGLVIEAVRASEHDGEAQAKGRARAAIGAFVDFVGDDPRKGRVLCLEALGSEALTRRRLRTLRVFAELVAAQGCEFYGTDDPRDPLVQTTALMLVGGLAETLSAWLDGTLAVGRDQLVEDCAALFVATGETAAQMARRRG